MKRLTALLVVLMFLVSACSSGSKPTSTTDAAKSPQQEPKKAVTLTFWHYFTDRAPLMEELAKEYEAKTGVKVKMELLQADVLAQKFQAAVQSGTAPDIVASWAGIGDKLAEFAKEGYILNLQPYMDQGWKDRFEPAFLESTSFKPGNKWGIAPGVYLVVLDANNMQILYNTEAYKKAGLQPPKTYEEWLSQAAKLKEAGYAPFSAGFGAWALPAFAGMYIWNVVGPADMEKTYKGEMPYTAEPWVKFLNLFVKMRDAGLLADGAISFDVPASESLFVNGKAATLFDGSWAIGVFNSMNPGFKSYDVFMPPGSTDGKYPVKIPGGVGALLFANGKSANKEEAVKFLQWLTDKDAQSKYAQTSFNLPAIKGAADPTKLSSVLANFSAHMGDIAPTLSATMQPQVETAMVKGIQNILLGKATPEQVAKEMEAARPKQ